METASVSHDEEHQHAVISFADGAKVRKKSETTKDLAKKNCLLSYHSALIAGASARQLMVLHSCLACLQRKNLDARNCSVRQCAASGIKTPFLKKIGEPFFKSLSEVSSDPRRHAEAPVVTYSALSSRWRGLSVSDVRTCPTPYALDALAQPSNRILAPLRSWAGQHAEAVTSARNSHGSIAVMPG